MGAVPQTAAIFVVTSRYNSGLLSFAVHSPEDSQATEMPVLCASNGPDRRDHSNTDRRLRALAPEGSITLRDGRLMSLVVAVEDVWTCLCCPRCPGGHGARPAGPRRAALDWRGRLMSRLRSGAGAAGRLRMPAGWKGPAVRENSSGRCHGAVPEAQPARSAADGVGNGRDRRLRGGRRRCGGHLRHADGAAIGAVGACPA